MLSAKRKLDFGDSNDPIKIGTVLTTTSTSATPSTSTSTTSTTSTSRRRSQSKTFLENEIETVWQESSNFWNFDFVREIPLPGGRWEWCRVERRNEKEEAPEEAYNTIEYSSAEKSTFLLSELQEMSLKEEKNNSSIITSDNAFQPTLTSLLPNSKKRTKKIPKRVPSLKDSQNKDIPNSERVKMAPWMLPTSPTLPVRT